MEKRIGNILEKQEFPLRSPFNGSGFIGFVVKSVNDIV